MLNSCLLADTKLHFLASPLSCTCKRVQIIAQVKSFIFQVLAHMKSLPAICIFSNFRRKMDEIGAQIGKKWGTNYPLLP